MGGEENPARDPAGLAGARPAAAAGNWDDPSAGGAGLRIPPFIARQGGGLDGRWPLQDFLELGALVSAVPCARLHARQVLWEWGIGHLGDSTELVVTELTTNAVRASRELAQAAAVRLWLLSDAAQILILVWDASPRPPVLADAGDEAEHGRGLMLVEAVSEQWGWSARADGGGKFVWAIVRLCLTPGKPDGRDRRSRRTVPNSLLPIGGALSRTFKDENSMPEWPGGVRVRRLAPCRPDQTG
jgi:anti-sigma regulatory factor (Ser/Thr protein kinase)